MSAVIYYPSFVYNAEERTFSYSKRERIVIKDNNLAKCCPIKMLDRNQHDLPNPFYTLPPIWFTYQTQLLMSFVNNLERRNIHQEQNGRMFQLLWDCVCYKWFSNLILKRIQIEQQENDNNARELQREFCNILYREGTYYYERIRDDYNINSPLFRLAFNEWNAWADYAIEKVMLSEEIPEDDFPLWNLYYGIPNDIPKFQPILSLPEEFDELSCISIVPPQQNGNGNGGGNYYFAVNGNDSYGSSTGCPFSILKRITTEITSIAGNGTHPIRCRLTNKVRYYYEETRTSFVTFCDCKKYDVCVAPLYRKKLGKYGYSSIFTCSERKIMARVPYECTIESSMAPCYKCDRSQRNETRRFVLNGQKPYTGGALAHARDNDRYAEKIAELKP